MTKDEIQEDIKDLTDSNSTLEVLIDGEICGYICGIENDSYIINDNDDFTINDILELEPCDKIIYEGDKYIIVGVIEDDIDGHYLEVEYE